MHQLFFLDNPAGSNPPQLFNDEGRQVGLVLQPGESKIFYGLWYRGAVQVNVAGIWRKGLREPLWIITNLEPQLGLEIYQNRMKIEQSFRDLKSLLNLDKITLAPALQVQV